MTDDCDVAVTMPHLHIWQFVHNAHGGWVWHCYCGRYRNNDGRISQTPASNAEVER